MTISRQLLYIFYALIGLLALVGTWGNNLQYFGQGAGIIGVNQVFWQETLANPASRSITVDILFIGLAAITWMFLEARRLSMRGIWLYLFASIFVAIGAAFPFFLAHRQRVLANRDASSSAGTLSVAELVAVVVLGSAILGYTFLALQAS